MSDNASIALTDTSDMIQLHRVFRESLGAAAPLVGSVPPGDAARAEVVGSYYANVLALLHSHHEGEDELVWPKLVDRAPEDAETIRRIAGQHEGVLTALEDAEAKLAVWRKILFIVMARNAQSATAFFNLPPNRVLELGAQIQV